MLAVFQGISARSLRSRLFLLAASGLVPLALVLLLSTIYLARERETGTQHAALELSRALATAVDAELVSTVALLQNLAIAADLDQLEMPELQGERFGTLARRVIAQQQWRTILVADGKGEIVMRALPSANRSGNPIEAASMAQVLSTGKPVVGRVARGPVGENAFAVRIPVLKDDRVRYVLSAVVPTHRILAVIARQQLAPAWVVAVFDQDGNRVARSIENRAARYSPSLEALVKAGGTEGMGIARTLEGVESHTGFTRVRDAQWIVAVGIPAAEARADLYRLLGAVGAGTAASLGLLALLAWRTAHSVSHPIDELKRAAAALGAGEQVELPPMRVRELDDVGAALRRAAADRDEADQRRSKVEEEREQLLFRLEEALRVAEAANRSKDEFLALLGHELRNPLAPITNAVHLMQLKGDSATAAERGIIQRQLQYVTRLVDDLLDASRITSKRFVMNLRAVRPVPVLEQTLESLQPMLGQRRMRVAIAPGAREVWIRADETRLVQIFNNLLGNAVKFTRPNGTLDVRVDLRGLSLEIIFSDDGSGMTAADLERAFDLFYQAPNGARAVNGGLGLGLAIVKSLVEMHSGSVTVDSGGLGRGTSVTLTLPICEPHVEEEAPPAIDSGFASMRILVVDDNQDAADTLGALLDATGFEVEVMYTPQAALDRIGSFGPELAILDIGLPGMDGYELARRLRTRQQPFMGKLIALTGYGQEQDVQKALAAGFDAHLTKPAAPDELLRLIARLLAGRPQH